MSKYVLVRNGMIYDPNSGLGGAREDGLLAIANDFIEDSGVVDLNGGDLLVSQQTSPNMSVKMAKGRLWIKNASWVKNTYDKNKFYPILIDAVENVNIDANSSGSTRYDLICVKLDLVNPPGDSGESAVTVVVVKGTPGAGVPAKPANHYKCAEIQVVSGATSITTSKITDTRNQFKLNSNLVPVADVASAIVGATEKTSVVDGDFFSLVDSAASFVLKKLSWANIKATLKATAAEVNAGANDAKFVTPKAIADSDVAYLSDIPAVPVKATGTDLSTGTNDTKFATALALANQSNRTMRNAGFANRRFEENINRLSPITTPTTYLKLTMGTGPAYATAIVDVTVGGILNGVSECGSHVRYWVRCNNTTVTITQIGAVENSGAGGDLVLTTSVSGQVASFLVNKSAGSSGLDATIFTEVKVMDGNNFNFSIAYS